MSRQALRGRTKINTWCQTKRPWSTRGGTSPEAKKGLLQAFARSSIDKFMISALFWCGCPHSPLQTFRAHPPANQQWVLQSLASRAIASWTLHQACSNLRSKGSNHRKKEPKPAQTGPSIHTCMCPNRRDPTKTCQECFAKPWKVSNWWCGCLRQNFQDGTKAVGKNRRQHQHVELYKFGDNLLLWMGKIQIPVFSLCALGKSQIRCRLAYMTLLILS